MPVPRASAALTRFTVLDLTRVRAGPTAVRQLRRLGRQRHQGRAARAPGAGATPWAARATGPTSRTCTATSAAITLDLKSADGAAVFRRLAAKADVVVENFRPDVKTRLGIDYATLSQAQPAPRLCQHLRLRPGRALRQAPGLRPDRAGHGRPHVDHRRAGPRADARRHSRSPTSRPASSARWASWWRCSSASSRARARRSPPRCCRRRSSCSTSRARAGSTPRRCRARPATTIQPASRPACSRRATATSTSPPPGR